MAPPIPAEVVEINDQQVIFDLTTQYFEKLAADPTSWDVLYRDRESGELWELTYPHSERHGGGPARLMRVESEATWRINHEVAPKRESPT